MRMLTRIRELINAHLKEWMSASHHVVTEKTPGLFRVGVDVGSAGEFCEGHRKGAGNEDGALPAWAALERCSGCVRGTRGPQFWPYTRVARSAVE